MILAFGFAPIHSSLLLSVVLMCVCVYVCVSVCMFSYLINGLTSYFPKLVHQYTNSTTTLA